MSASMHALDSISMLNCYHRVSSTHILVKLIDALSYVRRPTLDLPGVCVVLSFSRNTCSQCSDSVSAVSHSQRDSTLNYHGPMEEYGTQVIPASCRYQHLAPLVLNVCQRWCLPLAGSRGARESLPFSQFPNY